MLRLGKGRRTLMLLLPLLLGFAFQATQYARAPVDYNYYVVYAENADIALRPGNDLSPNGQTLLQNSTAQYGLYELTLGQWGPGYLVNYTDAFRVVNREVFNITMIGFNFTAGSTGQTYLNMRVQNDTDGDGTGDTWITAWNGTASTLNATYYVFLDAANSYGTDGGTSQISVDLVIPSSGLGLSNVTNQLDYSGQLRLYFTSTSF